MSEAAVLTPVIILLFVGIIGILLIRRMEQSPVVGYFLAGILIGLHAKAWMQRRQQRNLDANPGIV